MTIRRLYMLNMLICTVLFGAAIPLSAIAQSMGGVTVEQQEALTPLVHYMKCMAANIGDDENISDEMIIKITEFCTKVTALDIEEIVAISDYFIEKDGYDQFEAMMERIATSHSFSRYKVPMMD